MVSSGMRKETAKNRLSLAQALKLAARDSGGSQPPVPVYLACGFTPLHLSTFLRAHGSARFPDAGISIQSGTFEDLAGSLERLPRNIPTAVILEWSDLDPRLGLRGAAGWTNNVLRQIDGEVKTKLERLEKAIVEAAETSVVAFAGPTLPLVPIGYTGPAQETFLEIDLRAQVNNFCARLARNSNIRIVSQQELSIASPLKERLDATMLLASGYPYSLTHSDLLARTLIEVLFPLEPLKGLITDLDDTLWHGILGEIGVEKIGWTLETKAQHHGIYQQFLAALAERGVLLAIASKNNPELVEKALSRTDMFCRATAFFPVEISWGPKSESVGRILNAWNIGAADVVFIDDSPLELAEVGQNFPEMTCVLFPRRDPQAVWDLLQELGRLFARPKLQAEDQIRRESLRSANEFHSAVITNSSEEFLAKLEATLVLDFSKDTENTRSFELVNKTNQFNLNGRRWSDYEWRKMLDDPKKLLLTVSYADRFGPLGRIAVLIGDLTDGALRVDTWVMSCRAFSRRIEHAVLAKLVELFEVEKIELEFEDTERNAPTRRFAEEIAGQDRLETPIVWNANRIKDNHPLLYHTVKVSGLKDVDSRRDAASVTNEESLQKN